MTLFQLGSYLRGLSTSNKFGQNGILGILTGINFQKRKLTKKNFCDLMFYVFPEERSINYTEMDEKMPKVTRRLKNKKL